MVSTERTFSVPVLFARAAGLTVLWQGCLHRMQTPSNLVRVHAGGCVVFELREHERPGERDV